MNSLPSKHRLRRVIHLTFGLLVLSQLSEPLGSTLADDRRTPTSFQADIMPALRKNCIACHNSNKAEGGVNLESFEAVVNGDYDGLVAAGRPEESRILAVATHEDEPVMPPVNNNVAAAKLTPDELNLLRRWIEEGAKPDEVSARPVPSAITSLSPHIKATFATAMTANGRLAAAGVGNRIVVFDAKSSEPLATLSLRDERGNVIAPHVDFVQALEFTDNGRTLISAGYQNVKIWKANLPKPIPVPPVPVDAVGVELSGDGSTIVSLSRSGVLRVGRVGDGKWSSTIEIGEWGHETSALPQLSFNEVGRRLAVAYGRRIHLVEVSADQVFVSTAADITAVAWTGDNTLLAGDANGSVTEWFESGSGWEARELMTRDQPIRHLLTHLSDDDRSETPEILIVDGGGTVLVFDKDTPETPKTASLPAVPERIAWDGTGGTLWVTSADGKLATLTIDDGVFNVVASSDPTKDSELESAKWEIKIADRLVRAAETELAAAKATEKGASDNLTAIDKEIASKTKTRDEQQKQLEAARKVAQEAETAWQDAENALTAYRTRKTTLDAAIKEASEAISKLDQAADDETGALDDERKVLSDQVADAKQNLKELGNDKSLVAASSAAQKKFDDATKALKESERLLEGVTEGLNVAKLSKERSQSYLQELAANVDRRARVVDEEKSNRVGLDQVLKNCQEAASNTTAARAGVAFLSKPRLAISRPTADSPWSVWSPAGAWLFALPEATTGELIACENQIVLVKTSEGNIRAFSFPDTAWQLEKTLGEIGSNDPFPDRVLCLDVDPTGKLLATAAGAPTRACDVHVWNIADCSLSRRLEAAHQDTVQAVAFSPDGRFLASAGADQLIHVWDIPTGQRLKTLEGHTDYVTAITWDPSGRQLASGSSDGSIRVWDIRMGKSIRTISDPASEVTGLAYIGTADQLAAVTGELLFNVYTPASGRRLSTAVLPGEYAHCLSVSRDGSAFFIGDRGPRLVRVDSKGKVLATLEKP